MAPPSKTLGIVMHSAEGGALCLREACRYGGELMGEHLHPTVVASAVPMGLSMEGWRTGDHEAVAEHLEEGVRKVADAGADFWVCPDNTAHIVLEGIAGELPIPGLHIAEVVCGEIAAAGWSRVGLLGTDWTMTGPVYGRAVAERSGSLLVPEEGRRKELDAAIFDELCRGVFEPGTVALFLRAIDELAAHGAECVVLGCTEIPLIVTAENSSLPVLDSTRLLARQAVRVALAAGELAVEGGWVRAR